MANEWPKKMSASGYRDRWYKDLNLRTITNWIKKGDLPGEKEGGMWFVWVNEDDTPAFNAASPIQSNSPKISKKAQDLAAQIISMRKAV